MPQAREPIRWSGPVVKRHEEPGGHDRARQQQHDRCLRWPSITGGSIILPLPTTIPEVSMMRRRRSFDVARRLLALAALLGLGAAAAAAANAPCYSSTFTPVQSLLEFASFHPGDLNHDGQLDLVGLTNNRAVRVALGRGGVSFDPPVAVDLGAGSIDAIALGEVTGTAMPT